MPEINIEVDFRPVTRGLDQLADAYGPRARKAVVRSAVRRTLRESVAKIRARGISYSRSLAKSVRVSGPKAGGRRDGARDGVLSDCRWGCIRGWARAGSIRLRVTAKCKHVGSIEYGRRRKGIREAAHQRQLGTYNNEVSGCLFRHRIE